ncbi:Phenylacetate 2-hydroxylase [Yarrowia sp. C11]|nr:Phenylacetate 2-hydroxylase [Yarrowia sp. C11]
MLLLLLSSFLIAISTFIILDWLFEIDTETPHIAGLPAKRGYPIVGAVFQLGKSHPLTYQKWSEELGPVYQVRLGNKRVVVANSYASVRELWITNMRANISRPESYTFHKLLSSRDGPTIGTTPWGVSARRKRSAASTALNKPSVAAYTPIINLESYKCIRRFLQDCGGVEGEVDVSVGLATYSLNTSLTLNYGIMTADFDSSYLAEVMDIEERILRLRSTMHNTQDYIRYLRVFSRGSSAEAAECRERRAQYMTKFLNKLKQEIADGTDVPCIAGNILKDKESKITDADLRSICLTMVSAGFDTVPANLISCFGHLSHTYGQIIQKRALEAIDEAYPDGDAWEMCLLDDSKVHYIVALCEETVRYGSVVPMALPRRTIKDIHYHGVVIPAGTTLFMNAFAANFDAARFHDPFKFDPERYLDLDGRLKNEVGPAHFGFGAGSRMCCGIHLARKELYVALVRFLLAFRILPPVDSKDMMVNNPVEIFAQPENMTTKPPPFKVRLQVRDAEKLDRWLRETKEGLGEVWSVEHD